MQIAKYHNYIQDWMHLERYVNSGSDHKYAHQSDVPKEFRPEALEPYFYLQALDGDFTQREDFLPNFYPAHPFTAKKYRDLGHSVRPTNFKAIPTSSTRTMLVSNDEFRTSFFLKLDLPVRISRFDRSIDQSDVIFSSEIDKVVKDLNLKSSFAFGIFREVGGGYITLKSGHTAGYLTRELKPKWLTPQQPAPFYLVPSFSMISIDSFDIAEKPLLIQILKNSQNPREELFKTILMPLVDLWFALASKGILWEMQQQNTLFVLNEKHKVIGVAIRDYDGAYIDRVIYGQNEEFIKHQLIDQEQRAMRYSITFDHRVCKQNLLRLIDCYAQYTSGRNAGALKNKLSEYIEETMPHSVRTALPSYRWHTVPEVPEFRDGGLDTIVLASPPLRVI